MWSWVPVLLFGEIYSKMSLLFYLANHKFNILDIVFYKDTVVLEVEQRRRAA